MNKNIGIIACGWLGLPLAKQFVKEAYHVKGTTTSVDKTAVLQENGIEPYTITLSEQEINGPIKEFLDHCSILVINIPPRLRGKGPKESYVAKMQLLYTAVKNSTVEKIIFISSTSVYGDATGTVTEKTTPQPNTPSGIQILECEQLFQNDTSLQTTIIRFAGLIGPDRHPITMLSGRENLNGGNAPINLIHLDDCIDIIKQVIQKDFWGAILNGVHPSHPKKKEYYHHQAVKRGLKSPKYTPNEKKKYKLIST